MTTTTRSSAPWCCTTALLLAASFTNRPCGVDDEGVPTLFTHQATEHTSTALQPLHERTVTLFVPVPEDVAGPIDVAARLRFRPLPPFLLRLLELDQWIEQLVITDIDADAGQVLLED